MYLDHVFTLGPLANPIGMVVCSAATWWTYSKRVTKCNAPFNVKVKSKKSCILPVASFWVVLLFDINVVLMLQSK